mmetsp:Transcript_4440/g.10184  ORF Transcript_4440/g.10184 Transcript_4440/m.10184 type:complete len:263 (+) Transcript_4440:344-1132(+)
MSAPLLMVGRLIFCPLRRDLMGTGATVPTTSCPDTTSATIDDEGTWASSTPKTNFSFQKGSRVLALALVCCDGAPAGPCTRTTAMGLLSPSTPWGRLDASMTAITMRVRVPPPVVTSRALLLLTDRSGDAGRSGERRSGEGERARSAWARCASAALRASAACCAARSAACSASRALRSCSSLTALSLSAASFVSLAAFAAASSTAAAAASCLTSATGERGCSAPGERGCSEMSRRRPSLRLPVACCSVLMVFPCLTKNTCSM